MRISDWSSDVCSSDLRLARKRRNLGLARLGVEHGDEAGAEAFDAAIILVAVRLVDLALAAKLGFLGPDAHAIRLDRTVAASLADRAVDEHALRRIGEFPAFAAPALFGGAGLFLDDDGDRQSVVEGKSVYVRVDV